MKYPPLAAVVVLLLGSLGSAQTFNILYAFNCSNGDGEYPSGTLIEDASGNLYATTQSGGANNKGTIFELSPNGQGGWNETILHSFTGADGWTPMSGLTADGKGNMFGVTPSGGKYNLGAVFEISNGTFRVIYNFPTQRQGAGPAGALAIDAAGNLYGTTLGGGPHNGGTVFELSNVNGTWRKTTLQSFSTVLNKNGRTPEGQLLLLNGNIYGTTIGGNGTNGNVFELTPVNSKWKEKVLYNFKQSSTDGHMPFAGVIADASGNLYGTTAYGGIPGQKGLGTVYEISGTTEIQLHVFSGPDGQNPYMGSLVSDASGNFYGATTLGGSRGNGAVYKLTPTQGGWNETVLYSFLGGKNGGLPWSGLLRDTAGNLYGTAEQNPGCGIVFELTP